MTVRRTTVSADRDDLAVLEDEARRRGVSVALILRELVAWRAGELRREHRPRFGLGHGDGSVAQDSVDDEASPAGGQRFH